MTCDAESPLTGKRCVIQDPDEHGEWHHGPDGEMWDDLGRMMTKDALRHWDFRSQQPLFVAYWQPIETAPKDGTRVLLWLDSNLPPETPAYHMTCGRFVPEYGFWTADITPYPKPTHWMPLPGRPE